MLAVGCATAPMPTVTPAPTGPPTPTASPSPTPSPARRTPDAGPPSADCIAGWHAPPPDSPFFLDGLELLTAELGLEALLEVVEMRYFSGPDVPWIIEPHYPIVQRWYIKARVLEDPLFAGRWLLEERTEQVRGVAAVAPFDSQGFESPDWVGFFGEGPPREYPGLPGEWSGIPYDFVTGEGDSGQPGLPDEVIGCLSGT